MKKNVALLLGIFLLISCNGKDDKIEFPEKTLTLEFTHNWDGIPVTSTDFNDLKFVNDIGDTMSIERLRYLISRVTLKNSNGAETVLDGYVLVDVGTGNLTFSPETTLPLGVYTLSINFGFVVEDNKSGVYADLNTANFNVPDMMGGGYHFMQLDGKFIDKDKMEAGYNFHSIRAFEKTNGQTIFGKTDFVAELGQIVVDGNMKVEVKMNIAEWFKNPNQWNLNHLSQMLMPNYSAQRQISENGRNVFSLGTVTVVPDTP